MNESIYMRCKAYIEKYQMIVPGETVVVGVSGGADSVCLLMLLWRLSREMLFRILVVHINHGIRSEGAKDADYVKRLCAELELPFFLVEEDVKKLAIEEGYSEEEAGRVVRYRAFRQVLLKESETGGKIAVAHNAGDRAETMLFHLFRGTGLGGSSGIHPVRGEVIRPILCLERHEIESFLEKKGIAYCTDHTNAEDTYTRNKIRKHILCYARKEINETVIRNMWESGDRLLEAEEYLKKKTVELYELCRYPGDKNVAVCIDYLCRQEEFMQKQIILYCLEISADHKKDISAVHVEGIWRLLRTDGSGKTILPHGFEVIKEYDKLTFAGNQITDINPTNQCPIKLPDFGSVDVPGYESVEISTFSYEKSQIIPQKTYTKWFDYDRISRIPMFRQRKKGDYLTINSQMSHKTLKKYMIEQKISKYRRDDIYVLADGSHIMWVPGHRTSQFYHVTDCTKHILQVEIKGGFSNGRND